MHLKIDYHPRLASVELDKDSGVGRGIYKSFVLIIVSCLALVPAIATASFNQILKNNAKKGSPEEVLLTISEEVLNDVVSDEVRNEKPFEIHGRDLEADQVIDVLVRIKGSIPILIGAGGVGKTTIVQRAVQKVYHGQYPNKPPFTQVLDNSIWVSTSAGRMMRLVSVNNPAGRMAAIDLLFESIIKLQEKYERKFVLYIDEIHSLDSDQIEAMLPYLDSERRNIRIVGSTNSDKFQNKFKDNDAWLRRVNLIGVTEFDEQTLVNILNRWWVKRVELQYGVSFTENAVLAGVRHGITLMPEAGRFDASIKILQDVAISKVRQHAEEDYDGVLQISENEIFSYVKERTGYPVNPYDSVALTRYIEGLKDTLNSEIIDQPRLVSEVLGLYQGVMVGSKKGLGVGLVIGPTGTGKSELGLLLAKYGYKNPRAFLRIDANEYKAGSHSLMKLLGAEGGLVTSQERSGVLCEWFDDPSQGKYGGIILIDEGERAGPHFWERLMEFLDTGSFVGGDGKRRFASKHLVLITSNRGDMVLFPEGASKWTEPEMKSRLDEITPQFLKDLFRRKVSGRDEFTLADPILNRVDLFTVAKPLTIETARKIVKKEADKFVSDTWERFNINIHIDDDVINYLTELDYRLRDGARPIINRTLSILQDARTKSLTELSLERNANVHVGLVNNDSSTQKAFLEIRGSQGGKVSIELPKRKVGDPLQDVQLQQTLRSLLPNLKAGIIGQEDAVVSLSQAVIAHLGSPQINSKPFSIFLIGQTGVGKTEIGKVLANALFGSKERAEVIALGNIHNEAEFNNIFGSSPGYIGSDEERSFERFLMNNPKGGVVIWDEASNLGGNNIPLKDALFKKLYNLIEEGKWTSSATGTVYDLSKYAFIFTGNDGEKLFQGVTADDLLIKIHDTYKPRSQVRQILLASGVPAPFIGRMVDTILMKPLIRSEISGVVTNQLKPLFESFRNRGIEIELEEDFIDKFGKAFFSPETGARSLRSIIDVRVRGAITEALLDSGFAKSQESKPKIILKLNDTLITKAFLRDPNERRKVTLVASVIEQNKSQKEYEKDLSEFSYDKKVLPLSEAIRVAYHEAGHAVVNNSKLTGEVLRHLTIIGDYGNLGYASYDKSRNAIRIVPDRRVIIARLSRLLAGQVAVMLAGHPPNIGWSSDLRKVREIATQYIRDYGMIEPFQAVATDFEGRPQLTMRQREEMVEQMKILIQESLSIAEDHLRKKWPLVRRVVRELLDKGAITGEAFNQMQSAFIKQEEEWARDQRTAKLSSTCHEILSSLSY